MELSGEANKLKNGLSKIEETRVKVESMSKKLEEAKVKVLQFQHECDDFLIIIVQQKREADEQQKVSGDVVRSLFLLARGLFHKTFLSLFLSFCLS